MCGHNFRRPGVSKRFVLLLQCSGEDDFILGQDCSPDQGTGLSQLHGSDRM